MPQINQSSLVGHCVMRSSRTHPQMIVWLSMYRKRLESWSALLKHATGRRGPQLIRRNVVDQLVLLLQISKKFNVSPNLKKTFFYHSLELSNWRTHSPVWVSMSRKFPIRHWMQPAPSKGMESRENLRLSLSLKDLKFTRFSSVNKLRLL